MKSPRGVLFVESRAYRHRRVMDAARLLPVLAAVLIVLPLLWAPEVGRERDLATDTIYVFSLWACLILAARLLAPRLTQGPTPPKPPED